MIPVCLALLSGIAVCAQETEKTDTLPAAIKREMWGKQKSVSERIILPKDFSMLSSPVGEGDFVKLVQTLPGVALGSDGSSSYYVRGGNTGGNVQTLDGVPIYGSSHLVGLTTAYPSEVIGSAEFLVGGFSSEEGNLSSSHIKLRSMDGSFDTFSAKTGISNLLLAGSVSAPIIRDRLSLNASLRVSPVQYAYKALAGGRDSEEVGIRDAIAVIYDIYAKLKYKVDARRALSFTAFRNLDKYNFMMDNGSEDKMSWDNLLAILQYDSPWRTKGVLTLSASFNHYGNSQGMLKQMDKTSNNLQIRSLLNEEMIQARVNTFLGSRWSFQYGLKARVAHFNPGSARVLESTGLYPKTSSPIADKSMANFTGTLHGQAEHGSYERSLLRIAGRLNYNSMAGMVPEASLLLRLRLFEHLGLEATGDHLAQFYHSLEGIPLGWSLEMIVPPSKQLQPERTRQAYVGLYSDVGNHHFSAGAYYKELDNLVYFSDATKLFDSAIAGWEQNIEIGSGTSRGMELMYEKSGDLASWRLAYTWSKTDRLFPNLNKGEKFPAKYDRTHILNANASVRVLKGDRTQIYLASLFTYQSGHRETVVAGTWWDDNFITGPKEIDFYTSFNNYRMPPYIRCDVSALIEFTNRRHPQTVHLGVYNVLNRHNPFCISYDPDAGQWSQVSLLPIMPSVKYSIQF